MSFGYIGDTSTSVKQQVKNKGILTTQESFDLERQGFLGGSLELIEEQTVSSVTDVDFTSIKQNTYNVHFATWQFEKAVGRMDIRFYESGVLETGNVYQYARQTGQTDGTFAESKSTAFGGIPIDVGMTNKQSQGYIYFYNLGNSAKYSFATLQSFIEDYGFSFGGGVLPQTSAVDGIRFRNVDTANITGTLKLYGVKQ
tara:strand:- start:261 stop:857 length:597 start_codon:yes stop_codon:yes gene_type:complete